ncbi:MAG: aspartate aminotransferase family protein [Elusimicrobia bacterium]|nr:aspartate aminotransferase family protein [Elusimicrobiota bacterium]
MTKVQEAPIAGPKSVALFEEEQGYLTPGLQQIAVFSKLAMAKGKGAVLTDEDGKEYLDLVAGVCVASIGHGHPEYAKALAEQAANITVGSFTTKARVSFCRRLMPLLPKGLDRVQLYSSGAEAVEAAFRLAKSRTGHFEFLAFWGGFHGKTGGVLPLLGDTSFKAGLGPLMPGTYSAPYPNPYRCPFKNEAPHDCAAHCLEFAREYLKRSTTGSLAAVICEPIQGTAGNVIPPAGWLKGLKEIAHESGALLIADEMITGFGRTGKWFGVDHDNLSPDVMTVGKGVAGGFPVSGVITSAAIADSKPFANPSGSSSSYGGNPLAAAACDATLKILSEEDLVENSRKVGAKMLERLQGMKDKFPFIGDVRGRGLMIGVELVADKKTKEPLSKDKCRALFEEGLRRGIVTMAYSPVIRINPPLNITAAQADEALDRLEACFVWLAARG